MAIISLEGLEFFAFHGVYEEEQRIGNRFSIDVHIDAEVVRAGVSDELSDTIDYVRVCEIVAGVMKDSSSLLETLALNIITVVKQTYPSAKEVCVKVSKLNPPIGVICRNASVTMKG
ncbi:MAG: dihydroneopterin aldolase [Cytophagaceae bacterium SCN 52-12]|mgnify:CR=1 FL=1|nr:MAG: dihydroneopterin aldolase [Cytophagaceae bacterium SCN 52-12]